MDSIKDNVLNLAKWSIKGQPEDGRNKLTRGLIKNLEFNPEKLKPSKLLELAKSYESRADSGWVLAKGTSTAPAFLLGIGAFSQSPGLMMAGVMTAIIPIGFGIASISMYRKSEKYTQISDKLKNK
jgi:hypothetical protein